MNKETHAIFAPLTGRSFISVEGEEATPFLQTILTTNIDLVAVGKCAPSALLTPQGRILHDMMIYQLTTTDNTGAHFIIEVDENGLIDLFTRLRRYRLRRNVGIRTVDDMTVWLCWGGSLSITEAFLDPRHQSLGYRWLGNGDAIPPFANKAVSGDITQWQALRISAGVPEGPLDLIPERALMLEAGLDKLGAVDFDKGCYIGQEVTARTHYRGLVKRRLVPLRLPASPPPAPGTEILLNERVVATTKTTAKTKGGSLCLALIKLSDLHRVLDGKASFQISGTTVELSIPNWMQPLPRPSLSDRVS